MNVNTSSRLRQKAKANVKSSTHEDRKYLPIELYNSLKNTYKNLVCSNYLRTWIRKNKSKELSGINFYRDMSLLLTSLVFLLATSTFQFYIRVILVLTLCGESILFRSLFKRLGNDVGIRRRMIIYETILYVIVAFLTGSIRSPFIWYFVNPILFAARRFNITLSSENTILQDNKSYGLYEKNMELEHKNLILRETIEEIMKLYEYLEAFISKENIDNLMQTFTDYAARITRSEQAFFWLFESNDIMFNKSEMDLTKKELYLKEVCLRWDCVRNSIIPIRMNILDSNFLVMPVKSSYRQYGLLAIKINNPENDIKDCNKILAFLSNLSSTILERFHLEKIGDQLIIEEEQNRIAGEIHDCVSQQLFSIVCGTHILGVKCGDITVNELKDNLNTIKDTANLAMKQLRNIIYTLSSKKKGEKKFSTSLKQVVEMLSSLNNIDILLHINGDEEIISSSLKKLLYRITCEACGNSINHGKCTNLGIEFNINNKFIDLSIVDDGLGFNMSEFERRSHLGIGIYNMKSIVSSLGGSFKLISDAGEGTKIFIKIPNINKCRNEGEKIAL